MQDIILCSIPVEQLKSEITQSISIEIKKQLASISQKEDGLDLLSKKEAAKILGVSLPTILEWTKQGKVKGYRIGSRIRYKKSEIESSLTRIKTKLHDKED